jgi:hypothetical protein
MIREPDLFTLELVAQMLEARAGNALYRSAWKSAAKYVRAMKNLKCESHILNDTTEQITSISLSAG